MRYAVWARQGVRPLLAYPAGELAGANPESPTRRPPRSNDPRLFDGSRRSAVHGQRHAAARQATCNVFARRWGVARGRWRCSAGFRRARARRRPRSGPRLRAAGRSRRRARHGRRQAIDPKAVGKPLGVATSSRDASDEDRRADQGGGCARRACARRCPRRKPRRSMPTRRPPGSPFRSSTMCSSPRACRTSWARPREDARASKPTFVSLLASPPPRRGHEQPAPRRPAALAPFGALHRRLAELADWIVLRR